MSAVATTAPSALAIEEASLAQKRHGQESGGGAAAGRRATRRGRGAGVAAAAALGGSAGDRGGGAGLEEATAALLKAQQREAEAVERSASARRVLEKANGRLRGLRLAVPDELAVTVRPDIERIAALQGELEPLLTELRAAWGRAARRFKSLEDGTVQKVVTAHRERGENPSDRTIAREASSPACPLDAELMAALLRVQPTPLALRDGYEPGVVPPTPMVVEAERETVLFPGDPGHQENAGPNDGNGAQDTVLFPGDRGHQIHTGD